MLTNSALCEGHVTHHRHQPTAHSLRRNLSMVLLDLAEIDQLNQLYGWSTSKPALMRFKRSDYLDPHINCLTDAVHQRLNAAGITPDTQGSIKLLSQLRSWGFSFNPVSFYFCFNDSNALYAIIAEITNTPWQQRHAYVLAIDSETTHHSHQFTFEKRFHVSPFMPMGLDYDWKFSFDSHAIHINMKLKQESRVIFNANLSLTQQPLTQRAAFKAWAKYPAQSATTLFSIYWNALRLWLKGTPTYTHPDTIPGKQKPISSALSIKEINHDSRKH